MGDGRILPFRIIVTPGLRCHSGVSLSGHAHTEITAIGMQTGRRADGEFKASHASTTMVRCISRVPVYARPWLCNMQAS